MAARSFGRGAILLVLALGLTLAAGAQAASKQGAGTQPSLQTARQALAKKLGSEAFAAALESTALSLAPRDAVALIAEFAPKAPEAKRKGLYSLSASLSLLLGDYAPAAQAFVRAAGSAGAVSAPTTSSAAAEAEAESLIKACRCYLAAGDETQADKTLARVPDAAGGSSYVEAKRLVSAWSSLFSGKAGETFSTLKELAQGAKDADLRREALYLLWLLSASPDYGSLGQETEGWSSSELLARLRTAYPGSLELAAAEAKITLKPASWLLNSIYPSAVDEEEHSLADRSPSPAEPASAAATLQVGWFSREENAKSLAATLQSKGFSVSVEARETEAKEKRWAVLVKTTGDWTSAQAKLKDLGYESYLLP